MSTKIKKLCVNIFNKIKGLILDIELKEVLKKLFGLFLLVVMIITLMKAYNVGL